MRTPALLTAILLLALPAAADLPPGQWNVTRPISLPASFVAGQVYLPLDADALSTASLDEYRVVQSGRIEVPYRMILEDGQTQTQDLHSAVVGWTETNDTSGATRAIQITLDLGSNPPSANLVRLQLSGNDFVATLQIDQAQGKTEPGIVLEEGEIYLRGAGFAKDWMVFPPNRARYLRLLLHQKQGKLPRVDSVEVAHQIAIPLNLVAVPAKLTRTEDRAHSTTLLGFDPGRLTRDLASASFDIGDPLFDRAVTVEVATGLPPAGSPVFYTYGAGGRLRRTAPGEPVTLALDLPEARLLRVTIGNGDEQPLTLSRVVLQRAQRGLIFEADRRYQYQLWYGRRAAPAPRYDLARLPLEATPASLPAAALGPSAALPAAPPPPPPWSESHPAIFWTALIGVAMLL
ncbi:MAG: DUF3999 domain-containing protein, partial [Armatimonadetes bacterium]|nr:DUF3999 domain-containing protein [Armatimonadota bacterium]